MRLIDVDKAIHEEMMRWGCHPAYYGEEGKPATYALELLEAQPTVDVEEVKWISVNDRLPEDKKKPY